MKYFLIAAVLLSTCGLAVGQQDNQAKYALYHRCIDQIEKDPAKAFEYCSEFVNKYPNGDEYDYAFKFVTAYKRISQYVKSVPISQFAEVTKGWAVYSPGLMATIPCDKNRGGNYSVVIKREFCSPDEEKLLAKAESVYKNPEPVESDLLKQWRRYADPNEVLPDGQPKWWTAMPDVILSTELLTTEAVLYYVNITQTLRSKGGKLKEKSNTFSHANLKYEASIKKMDAYERAGKSFKDVYVANMTMTWAQVCGNLCGYGFTRNKIVVMSPTGEILEMFIDDPRNDKAWIS